MAYIISFIQNFEADFPQKSQPQNPEFMNNPENVSPFGCILYEPVSSKKYNLASTRIASANSVDSDIQCTLRIYFDNMMLTLRNVIY